MNHEKPFILRFTILNIFILKIADKVSPRRVMNTDSLLTMKCFSLSFIRRTSCGSAFILHELDSVLEMFLKDNVDEKNIGIAVSRLRRITTIQKVLIDQLNIIETMTPLDFWSSGFSFRIGISGAISSG